jgi:hypothetical protein
MGVQFTCPNCRVELIYAARLPGQEYQCYKCGHAGHIPGSGPQEIQKLTSEPAPTPPGASIFQPNPNSDHMPFLSIFALIANAAYLLLSIVGTVSKDGDPLDTAGVVALALYAALVISNMIALVWSRDRSHVVLVSLNLLVFGVIAFLFVVFSPKPTIKLGGGMQLIVGLVTVSALLLAPKDSWLSLYFERRRLEEKRKIAALEQDPRSRAS